MTSATHKRVALRLLPRRLITGILEPSLLRSASASTPPLQLELLLPDGQLFPFARAELQAAFFIGDFTQADLLDTGVPRGSTRLPGVRVRCRTRDRQFVEGLLASDLLALSQGLELSPPYVGCPWQRIYLPAYALDQLQIIEVVHPIRHRRQPPTLSSQHSLFELPARE